MVGVQSPGFGLRACGSDLCVRIEGLEFRVWCLGFGVKALGFRVWAQDFSVQDLGSRV